ncbi:FlgD immunoglobulin-like domain containing protein [Gracilinema caldarium]|uniref:FlgD immunoglobulin-like domain containing protein n=1 Tax=Gracilinema caldarium TaxID=215591 RepID=UPI0026EA44CB|nr:FlgD immunoglobulin-like domain containing protein [Gracilinema caldarium]
MKMNQKVIFTWLFLFGSVSLLFLSCTTSSGSTYSRSVNADEEAARRNRAAQEKNSGTSGNSTSGGSGTSTGNSSWNASDPYNSGWETSNTVIIVREVPPHGTLKLLGFPYGSPVIIDGDPRIGNTFDLSPGTHHIEVRVFGFEVWEDTVQINKDSTVVLRVELVPADFRIIDVEMQSSSLNPDNLGYFGAARLTVYVTAPGSVSLQVLDQKNRLVRPLGPYEITKGAQDVFWDGTDSQGRMVPKGRYTLVVQGLNGAAQPMGEEFRHYVYVKSGLTLRTWLGGSGFSEPFFVPDAQVLHDSSWSLSTAFVSHLASPAEPVGSTLVSLSSLRLALSEYAEAGMLVTYVGRPLVSDISTDWIGFTATAKLKLTEAQSPFSAAVGIRGSFRSFTSDSSSEESTPYIPPAWDGLANYDGLSISVPLEYGDGPLRLFAAPELQVSTFYPYWTDDRWSTPDLFIWSTLRLGAELRISNPVRLALSAAMKSDPLNKGSLTLQLPLSLGAELSVYTKSPINFTAYALAEAGGPYSYAIYGGIGIGGRF